MKRTKMEKSNYIDTARTLAEALPYLQRYDKSIVVIKLGGHAMTDRVAMENFARDVVLMKQCNVNPVVVHGGGPMIDSFLKKMNIDSKFVNGKRVTSEEAITAVEMVLTGNVNKTIVSAINKQGGKGVGLSGKDANLMVCDPDDPALGFVGIPKKLDPSILKNFLESDFIPVIAPIGIGFDGKTYNVNADDVAGAIAGVMNADRLLLLTDVSGIEDKEGNVLTKLSAKEVENLIIEGTIVKGMIPKAQTAIRALSDGVRAVVILDGRAQNACLLELFTDHGAGTLVRN
ncbi:MAG: acetylglutamate kinase [Pseudomonadota bacterium]|nr:acetylglutamate kinase [Pseudomonadota bacterium]